jgi:hypothetical protein
MLIVDMLVCLHYIMNMQNIESLVDSLIVLATWSYIWNCLDQHWHVPP